MSRDITEKEVDKSALSNALKNNDLEAVKMILSVPSLEIDVDQLRSQNIPRDTIMECMKIIRDNLEQKQHVMNRTNNNLMSLMALLGGGGGSMECLKMVQQEHQQMVNRANSQIKSLMALLGGGGVMECPCPVCVIPFTAQRRVFSCGNCHFICGDCKERLQVCSLIEALNTKSDWLHF